MARLRLSVFIAAPIEDVYQYVTDYGEEGPVSDEAFKAQYGKVIEQDGHRFVIEEDVRRYPEDEPDIVTWRCTFTYPTERIMEAIDSLWSDRADSLRSANGGTQWTIRWRTKIGGVQGIVQYLFFQLFSNRRMKRDVLNPVKEHFEGDSS